MWVKEYEYINIRVSSIFPGDFLEDRKGEDWKREQIELGF